MIYEIFENEVVMLLIGVGVLIFILTSRPQLKRLPASNVLIVGFYVLLVGWVLTVLEGFFWEQLLDHLEHMCYAVSSVLVAIWCWKVFGSGAPSPPSRGQVYPCEGPRFAGTQSRDKKSQNGNPSRKEAL